MKLPRYLQWALAATAALVVWSHFSAEEPDPARPDTPIRPPLRQSKPIPVSPLKVTLRSDLFAIPTADQAQVIDEPQQPIPETPSAPSLPLQALGAWWPGHQRILVLTDGRETWPVCLNCSAENSIWIGSSPVKGWTLKAVEKDHLLFEWQLTHSQQRLELGDLQSEPTQ